MLTVRRGRRAVCIMPWRMVHCHFTGFYQNGRFVWRREGGAGENTYVVAEIHCCTVNTGTTEMYLVKK